MKLLPGWIAVLLVFATSCINPENTGQSEFEALEARLSTLKPGEALIKVLLGNRDFYARTLPFKTTVQLLPKLVKLSFVNEEDSNVEMEMIRDDWFEHKPVRFTLTNSTLGEIGGDQVALMIGKMTDKLALRGEGYFLVNGKIEIPKLSRQVISINFEGNLVKPSQASTVENYVPVKGWIVIKEPAFSEQSSAELVKRID